MKRALVRPPTHGCRLGEQNAPPLMALLVAATLMMSGCASRTAPPVAPNQRANTEAPYRLPTGAKVALKQGGPKRTTMVRDIPSNNSKSLCDSGLDHGGPALAFNPFLMTGWALVCAVERAMADPSAVPQIQYVKLQEPAAEGFAKSLGELRPLSERVQGYARERGLGEFTELPDQRPQSAPDDLQDREAPGYVFELAVAHVELHRRGEHDIYYLRLTAEGRLVQLEDKRVVDKFTARIDSPDSIIASWRPEAGKRFSPDFDFVLDRLAKRFVNQWIEPALHGSR